jgi:hypothetical protein
MLEVIGWYPETLVNERGVGGDRKDWSVSRNFAAAAPSKDSFKGM